MKQKLLIAVMLCLSFALLAQPTNPPVASRVSVTITTNSALIGYGTNIFWTNIALIRRAGIVAPTNTPSDGWVATATGDSYKWTPAGDVSISIPTNCITTNTPSGTTQTVASIVQVMISGSWITNGTIGNAVAFGNHIPQQVPGGWGSLLTGVGTVNWGVSSPTEYQRTNAGYHYNVLYGDPDNGEAQVGWTINGGYWTNLNALKLVGVVPPSNLGLYSDVGTYGLRFLRSDGTFQSLPGGGDMLVANNLGDVLNVGTARTNLLAFSATNITTDTMNPLRLGSGSSITTKFLRGDSTWQTISGTGDLLAANNLDDVADAGTSRTNLLTFSGTNITADTVAPARLGSGTDISTKYLRGDSTWQTIAGGGDLLAENNLTDVENVNEARSNLLAHAAGSLTEGVVARDRLADGGNLTNLIHAPHAVAGDVYTSVTAATNGTTQQRTYTVGASTFMIENVINPLAATNIVVVSGLNGCVASLDKAVLVKYTDNTWAIPGYPTFDASPVYLELGGDGAAADGQWWLFAGVGGYNSRWTNSAIWGSNICPCPPVIATYQHDRNIGGCGSSGPVTVSLFSTSTMLTNFVSTPQMQLGLIVPSNAWVFKDEIIAKMNEGDVWYTSSNGIPTKVALTNGVSRVYQP